MNSPMRPHRPAIPRVATARQLAELLRMDIKDIYALPGRIRVGRRIFFVLTVTFEALLLKEEANGPLEAPMPPGERGDEAATPPVPAPKSILDAELTAMFADEPDTADTQNKRTPT